MASAPFGAVKVFDAPARSPGDAVMITKYPRGALGLHGFSALDRGRGTFTLVEWSVGAAAASERQVRQWVGGHGMKKRVMIIVALIAAIGTAAFLVARSRQADLRKGARSSRLACRSYACMVVQDAQR
jgi:hypothetical protein